MSKTPRTNLTGTRHGGADRGAVLILALWLVLIAGVMLLGLNRAARVSAASSATVLEEVHARWAARAGVETAMAVLADDFSLSDGRTDTWWEDAGAFEDVDLGNGYTFRVTSPPDPDNSDTVDVTRRLGLDDAASRVNLNAASGRWLRGLPGGGVGGADLQLDRSVADAIQDWRDGNEGARNGGAERGYYADLDFPYEIRNGPLQTRGELLLIKGVDAELAYGEDTDRDGLLSRPEDDGDETLPPDDRDGRLERGLAAVTTVYSYDANEDTAGAPRTHLGEANALTLQTLFGFSAGLAEQVIEEAGDEDDLFDLVGTRDESDEGATDEEIGEFTIEWLAQNWESVTLSDEERGPGKLNLNTASRAALESVPRIRDQLVQAIMDRRTSGGDFTSVGELLTESLTDDRGFERVAEYFTVTSNVFAIHSRGSTPRGTAVSIDAVVDRGGTTPVVLSWEVGR